MMKRKIEHSSSFCKKKNKSHYFIASMQPCMYRPEASSLGLFGMQCTSCAVCRSRGWDLSIPAPCYPLKNTDRLLLLISHQSPKNPTNQRSSKSVVADATLKIRRLCTSTELIFPMGLYLAPNFSNSLTRWAACSSCHRLNHG